MADDKKKGGGFLLAISGKDKKPPPLGGPLEPDGDEPEPVDPGDEAFEAFADAVGIPEESRAAAKEALHEYVKACEAKAGDEEEGY